MMIKKDGRKKKGMRNEIKRKKKGVSLKINLATISLYRIVNQVFGTDPPICNDVNFTSLFNFVNVKNDDSKFRILCDNILHFPLSIYVILAIIFDVSLQYSMEQECTSSISKAR